MCFSDSTQVQSVHCPIARNERVFARKGEKIRRLRKRRRPKKTLHTYGVLTKHGMVGPFFVAGNITAHRYLSTILPKMLVGIQDIFDENKDDSAWTFMQDGASPHTANATQRWLQRQSDSGDVKFWTKYQWPGNSPDLNPIEGMWTILQIAVTPKGTDQMLSDVVLRNRTENWFSERHRAVCRSALRGMAKRCVELREADFYAISH